MFQQLLSSTLGGWKALAQTGLLLQFLAPLLCFKLCRDTAGFMMFAFVAFFFRLALMTEGGQFLPLLFVENCHPLYLVLIERGLIAFSLFGQVSVELLQFLFAGLLLLGGQRGVRPIPYDVNDGLDAGAIFFPALDESLPPLFFCRAVSGDLVGDDAVLLPFFLAQLEGVTVRNSPEFLLLTLCQRLH